MIGDAILDALRPVVLFLGGMTVISVMLFINALIFSWFIEVWKDR